MADLKVYYDLLPSAIDVKLHAILDHAVAEERFEDAAKIKYELDKHAAKDRLKQFITSINDYPI